MDIIGYKQIKDFEDYYINKNGIVISAKREQFKILAPNNAGHYGCYNLSKNNQVHQYRIHRLVAQTFIPNPRGLRCVNHIDGNKYNNNVENLEWCNYAHNARHMHKVILKGRGTSSIKCEIYYKGEFIKSFNKIIDACKFASETYNVGRTSIQKYFKVGDVELRKV